MLRRLGLLRCQAKTLTGALNSSESVWNLKFGGKPITHEMNFHDNVKIATPMFSILSLDGKVECPEQDPQIPREICEKMMTVMVRQNTADVVMLESQRQGRISFYMSCFGEEAQSCASAAALHDDDMIFMQYREAPAIHYRGYTLSNMIAQCMGNIEDPLKGRQMPIHYGSKEYNVQMVSSPLGTQIPHAAGAGYAYKLENNGKIVACYFGDGAASEGDFHAGINFASIVGSHTLFICRNNGFAISTPAHDQYNGDGILPRGIAYGIPSIRVDGHDALAVYAATKRAREIILERHTPVLIETMSYRVSHHSTSDDSTAYRSREEIDHFNKLFTPIKRFGAYLQDKGWWTPERTKQLQEETMQLVQSELARQESLPPWPTEHLFEDTFAVKTPNLEEQKAETMEHLERNKHVYQNLH